MRPGRSIVSAGRIGYALGKLCGRIAGEAVKGDMIDYDHLRSMRRSGKTYGKQQNRSFALKEFVINHADDRFLQTEWRMHSAKKNLKR